MESLFSERIYGIPWVALAAAAVLLALAYAVIPGSVDADGWRWIVMRWFHTVAWAFFALAAIARAKVTPAPIEVAAPLAATGGLAYVALMLAVTAGQS
jgi:hypothetical protein